MYEAPNTRFSLVAWMGPPVNLIDLRRLDTLPASQLASRTPVNMRNPRLEIRSTYSERTRICFTYAIVSPGLTKPNLIYICRNWWPM